MARKAPNREPTTSRLRRGAEAKYLFASQRPLHVLVFLLPLIVAYEVGSILYLTNPAAGVVETIAARSILSDVFETFGALSFHLPAVLLIVILLIWHTLERDPWKVRPKFILGMTLESVLWTLPLLVLGLLLLGKHLEPTIVLDEATSVANLATNQVGHQIGNLAAYQGPGGPAGDIASMPWQHRLTLSIGAGLYEELLFRLILILALHFVFADVMRLSKPISNGLAAILSAIAFAMYHANAGASPLPRDLFVFYAVAGLYFAILFINRGFGVVVATHALYDIVVLLA